MTAMAHRPPFANADVAAALAAVPQNVRSKLLEVRRLIYDAAVKADRVGRLEETLRWGEPSYLTSRSKSGSMVRIAWKKAQPDRCGIYFHCQTNLVATFKQLYPDVFAYEGNRGISFSAADALPADELSHCVTLALTYHLDKRRGRRA